MVSGRINAGNGDALAEDVDVRSSVCVGQEPVGWIPWTEERWRSAEWRTLVLSRRDVWDGPVLLERLPFEHTQLQLDVRRHGVAAKDGHGRQAPNHTARVLIRRIHPDVRVYFLMPVCVSIKKYNASGHGVDIVRLRRDFCSIEVEGTHLEFNKAIQDFADVHEWCNGTGGRRCARGRWIIGGIQERIEQGPLNLAGPELRGRISGLEAIECADRSPGMPEITAGVGAHKVADGCPGLILAREKEQVVERVDAVRRYRANPAPTRSTG